MGKSSEANVAYAEKDERAGPPGDGEQVVVAVGHVTADAEVIPLPAPPEGRHQDPEAAARGIITGKPLPLGLRAVGTGQRVQALQLDESWRFGAVKKVVLVQNGKLLHICYEDGSTEASVRWTTIKLVGVEIGDTVCLPQGTEVTVSGFATRGRVKADVPTRVLLRNNVTGGRLGINPENSRPKDTPSIWWPSSPPQPPLSMPRDVSPHSIFPTRNGDNPHSNPTSKSNPNPNPNPHPNPNPNPNQAQRASWRSRGILQPQASP